MSLLLQHHLILPTFKVQETIIHSKLKGSKVIENKMKKLVRPQIDKSLPRMYNYSHESYSIIGETNLNCSTLQGDLNYPREFLNTSKDETIQSDVKQKLPPGEKKLFKSSKVIKTLQKIDLQSYLGFMSSVNNKKIQSQNSLKSFLSIIDARTTLFNALYVKKRINVPTIRKRISQVMQEEVEVPLQSVEDNQGLVCRDELKFIRIDRINNFAIKQARFQKAYENENAEQIQSMKSYIHSLTKSMFQLRVFDHLNNSRKFYQVMRNLIGIKKNLYKLIFQQEMECIIEPLNDENITKGVLYKDNVFDKGDILSIEKYNFEILADLRLLCDKCENLLLEIKMAGLNYMEQNIVAEHDDICKLSNRYSKGFKSLSANDLRYVGTGMRRYMINDQVEAFENKLGELPLISKESRRTNQNITAIVERMNKRSYV